MIIRSITLCLMTLLFAFIANAQVVDSAIIRPDTTVTPKDTIANKKVISEKAEPRGPVKDSARLAIEALPRKAILRSALLPGLGQYYNKGLWWLKVPAIYGGLIAFGIAIHENQSMYNTFLKEAQYRQLNNKPENPLYEQYTDEGIIRIKDGYRRNRDLSILGAVGVYAANIIEAYVDAKFFRFDINDDLSFNAAPSIQYAYTSSRILPVVKLSLAL